MQNFKIGGVPLHPALVHFPVAAWTLAVLADAVFFFTQNHSSWTIAYWALAAGAIMGIFAMSAGFIDFLLLGRSNHPALTKVQTHMLFMGSAWSLFLMSLLLRSREVPEQIPLWLLAVTGVGFVLLAIGGHLGGRLVYEHGVGVNEEK